MKRKMMREVFVSSLGFAKPEIKPDEEFVLVIDTPGGLKKVYPGDPSYEGFRKTYGV